MSERVSSLRAYKGKLVLTIFAILHAAKASVVAAGGRRNGHSRAYPEAAAVFIAAEK